MLEASGFRKVLTDRNRTEAIDALHEHFAFYRHLRPLTQYIEGLQLHGVLKATRQQAVLKDTIKLFLQGKFPSAEEMGEFFRATFSENESDKALEEIIVYNMKKFFKKVERGSITTQWISEENGDEETILVHMGHVCKAFTGSMNLPRSIPCGIIEFDHTSHKLSNVNTCAQSIKCSKTKDLEDYEQVEVHMLYIIVRAPDFGIE